PSRPPLSSRGACTRSRGERRASEIRNAMIMKGPVPAIMNPQPATAFESEVLTTEALAFLSRLAERFEPTRQQLLANRATRLNELRAGKSLDFLPETADIRGNEWKVAPIPHD